MKHLSMSKDQILNKWQNLHGKSVNRQIFNHSLEFLIYIFSSCCFYKKENSLSYKEELFIKS